MRIILAVAVICAALTACGGSSADPDVAGDIFDGLVSLSDAGAGEQRTLRYNLAEGDRGRSTMTFMVSLHQEFDGVALSDETIEYSVVMEYEVTAVSAEGDYDVTTRFVEIDAEPLFRDALAPMMKLVVEQTISPRGEIRDVSFPVPAGIDPSLTSMLDQMSDQVGDMAAPLPLQPVGVGAVWSHTATSDVGGLELTMVSSYEVIGFDGDRVLLATSVDVTDYGEEMTPPGMPPGTKVSITDFEQTGTGAIAFDLTQPLPSDSSMTMTQFMSIHVEADGESGDMDQSMTMEMTVSDE